MKTLRYAVVICLAFFIACASSAWSQEYTFVADTYGQHVCIGRWVPSTTGAQGGTCEGEMIGLAQLSAISARQSLDRLEQLVTVLSSISDKIDVSNDQVNLLIEVISNSQMAAQNNEALSRAITQRFAALSLELTNDEIFKEEISSLRKDILKEVEKRYPTTPAGAAK